MGVKTTWNLLTEATVLNLNFLVSTFRGSSLISGITGCGVRCVSCLSNKDISIEQNFKNMDENIPPFICRQDLIGDSKLC